MQEIIFYDSKNVPYMTWYNFSYNQQNGTLLFNVQFEYSIFNISECYKTNITQIINFEKELQDLYHGLSHKISFMSDDYSLYIELVSNQFGHIYQYVHLTKKSYSGTEFTLHLDIDQSFIPELLNFIHEISQIKPCVESIDSTYPNICNIDFIQKEKFEFNDYIHMNIKLKESFFQILMDTDISTDELISFKQDLTLFQEEKISEVLLAPLGEYWSIRFIRAKDGVKIQGNICDKNIIFLQHNLTFNWIVNQDWMHHFQQKIFSI